MSLPISRYFVETLDAPLRNERWSWGASSGRLGALVLRLWDHERDGTALQVFKERAYDGRPGQSERRGHLGQMLAGAPAWAVICTAKDPLNEQRSILRYDGERLARLGMPWRRDDGLWFAPILEFRTLAELERSASGPATLEGDLREIDARALDATTRRALADARIGQGWFRDRMLKLWDQRCAVTGCSVPQALRASHAKPWRSSSDRERLDPHNGLPLVATLDALFDCGLIGFDPAGGMLVSARLSAEQRAELGLPRPLRRKPGKRCEAYLRIHRETIFR